MSKSSSKQKLENLKTWRPIGLKNLKISLNKK